MLLVDKSGQAIDLTSRWLMDVADHECSGGKTWLSTLSSGRRPQNILHWYQLIFFQCPGHRAAEQQFNWCESSGSGPVPGTAAAQRNEGQWVGQQIYRAVWGTQAFVNKSCTELTALVWLAALTLDSTINRFTFKLSLHMLDHTHKVT